MYKYILSLCTRMMYCINYIRTLMQYLLGAIFCHCRACRSYYTQTTVRTLIIIIFTPTLILRVLRWRLELLLIEEVESITFGYMGINEAPGFASDLSRASETCTTIQNMPIAAPLLRAYVTLVKP